MLWGFCKGILVLGDPKVPGLGWAHVGSVVIMHNIKGPLVLVSRERALDSWTGCFAPWSVLLLGHKHYFGWILWVQHSCFPQPSAVFEFYAAALAHPQAPVPDSFYMQCINSPSPRSGCRERRPKCLPRCGTRHRNSSLSWQGKALVKRASWNLECGRSLALGSRFLCAMSITATSHGNCK